LILNKKGLVFLFPEIKIKILKIKGRNLFSA